MQVTSLILPDALIASSQTNAIDTSWNVEVIAVDHVPAIFYWIQAALAGIAPATTTSTAANIDFKVMYTTPLMRSGPLIIAGEGFSELGE